MRCLAVYHRDRIPDRGGAFRLIFCLLGPLAHQPSRGTRRRHRRGGALVVQGGGCQINGPGSHTRSRPTIPSFTSPGTTSRSSASGPDSGCRPKQNGSTPSEEVSSRSCIPEATSSAREASICATSGRESFRAKIPATTASAAPARQRPSPQCLRPLLHNRKHLGVVRRLVQPGLSHDDRTEQSAGPVLGREPRDEGAHFPAISPPGTANASQPAAPTPPTSPPRTWAFASRSTGRTYFRTGLEQGLRRPLR